MSTGKPDIITLRDDLILKVSSLLMEGIGSTREVQIELGSFPLDADLYAADVTASVRLTKLNTGILAQGSAKGIVDLECVRCLRSFENEFSVKFAEQFRQTTDVFGGHGPASFLDDQDEESDGDDELAFEINDAHEIDLTELLRQWILLALPMNPICGKDCPGPDVVQQSNSEVGDSRFAALQELLDSEE